MSDIALETFSGEEVVDELARLREDYVKTGAYPVLLGDEEDCDHIQECMEFGADDGLTQANILAASMQINPEQFLAEQGECVPSDGQPGEWPAENVEPIELVTYLDLETGSPKEEVAIALLRVRQPWEVFATLMWGGWNACADAANHCAVHRRWYKKYGAEVVSVTGDCVQCWVARPPATQEEALQLAWEQYAYCPDIVLQGTETVSALAAALMVSEFWYFWWE